MVRKILSHTADLLIHMETNKFPILQIIYSEILTHFVCIGLNLIKRNSKSSEHIDAVAFLPDQETIHIY